MKPGTPAVGHGVRPPEGKAAQFRDGHVSHGQAPHSRTGDSTPTLSPRDRIRLAMLRGTERAERRERGPRGRG